MALLFFQEETWGTRKTLQTTNDDETMAARPSGDEAVRCDPPSVPRDDVDDAEQRAAPIMMPMDLQAEEPGYGYGV